jgi:hypothetical protein
MTDCVILFRYLVRDLPTGVKAAPVVQLRRARWPLPLSAPLVAMRSFWTKMIMVGLELLRKLLTACLFSGRKALSTGAPAQ